MITIRQSYVTTDGQIFLKRGEAEQHETDTFKAWLKSCPLVDLYNIFETADDLTNEEFYGTEKDMVINVAKRAFQLEHQNADASTTGSDSNENRRSRLPVE